MVDRRFLVLGGGDGWHADQLRSAGRARDCSLAFGRWESLSAEISSTPRARCDAGPLDGFDAILTRTMPMGGLEPITFRLAILHDLVATGIPIVNPPRALEIAIDKFATLAEVSRLGVPVPETRVVQSRGEAIDAFRALGSDCVVKPIFGGEGRGVMRIRDPELAWTTFSTLQQLGAVSYIQRFISPGGRDTRVLVAGDRLVAVRRVNETGFRTNVGGGGVASEVDPTPGQADAARRITGQLRLAFAAVDFLDADDGVERVVEVNAIPGWKGAQAVVACRVAEMIVDLLIESSAARPPAPSDETPAVSGETPVPSDETRLRPLAGET